jgi:hypothetical protein
MSGTGDRPEEIFFGRPALAGPPPTPSQGSWWHKEGQFARAGDRFGGRQRPAKLADNSFGGGTVGRQFTAEDREQAGPGAIVDGHLGFA